MSSPEYHREWRAKNPDKVRASRARYAASEKGVASARRCGQRSYKKWKTRDPERARELGRYRVRKWRLKHKYGLELPDVESLLTSQGGTCVGCQTSDPHSAVGRDWSVDHCHATGKVRGILCANCNSTLGFACDKPSTLRRLADYLER